MGMNTRHNRLAALLATTAVAAAAPALAAAQQSGNAADSVVSEVVVTANRREELAQRVPVAVTALSNRTLAEQGIDNVSDLLGRVPSLNVAPNATQRDAEGVTIRGQGQTFLAPVGVVNYFAEVPLIQGAVIANQGGPGTFLDLQSLQVLRGPQGTLFGKNTTGGALLFGPQKPTNRLEGYVQAQVGDYNDREFEAVLNVPLIDDKLMVRIAAQKVDRDGYTKDVGTADATLSLPFQAPGFRPLVIPNSNLVLPGKGPSTGIAGLPGLGDTTASFAGKDYDDRHYSTVRFGLLFRPTDRIENYLVGYFTDSHNNGTGQVLVNAPTNHPSLINLVANAYGGLGAFNALDPALAQAVVARQRALGPRRVSLNTDQFYKLKTWALVDTFSAKLTDNLTFRNIVAYQRMRQRYAWDLDGSYLPVLSQVPGIITQGAMANLPQLADIGGVGQTAYVTDASLFTEEPQLHADYFDGKLVGVLGAFYSKQKPEGLQGTGSYNAATYGGGFFGTETVSKAIYGQGTVDLGLLVDALDRLKLTLGARHTWDSFDGFAYSPGLVSLPVSRASDDQEANTWTVGLDYQVTPNDLVYAKVTRGYKAGGFNSSAVQAALATFGPEYVTSYEIGAKTDHRIGDVPVRFNVNLYELKYRDIQRTTADIAPNGCGVPGAPPRCALTGNTSGLDQGAATFNVGAATVRGVELDASAELFRGFTLSGSYSYTDAHYTNFFLPFAPGASATGPQAGIKLTCAGPVPIPNGVGAPTTLIDLTCSPFPFSPEHQYSLNARYSHALGDAGELVFNLNYNHADKSWTSSATLPIANPFAYADEYDVVNASVEWNSILGSKVDARVFVTNLTDTTYRISNSNGGDAPLGYNTAIYNEPRMYGLSLRYSFGD
jgi:iron complex outermembrane recepter protein